MRSLFPRRTPDQAKGRSRRGNALIEFSLLGIPLMFITISIVSVSIDMWEYHCLAYSTEVTARYASVHGATCASPNSCFITIGTLAAMYSRNAMALDPAQVIVKFTDANGTTTCNPVNSCTSSSTQFPSSLSNANAVGNDVTVSATYILKNPIAMFWPPNQDAAGDFTVGAKSRQRIMF